MKAVILLLVLILPMARADEAPSFSIEALKDSVRITIVGAGRIRPLSVGVVAPIELYLTRPEFDGVVRVAPRALSTFFALGGRFSYLPAVEKQSYSILYRDLMLGGGYDHSGGRFLGPVSSEFSLTANWKNLLTKSKVELLWHATGPGEGRNRSILISKVVPAADTGQPASGPIEAEQE